MRRQGWTADAPSGIDGGWWWGGQRWPEGEAAPRRGWGETPASVCVCVDQLCPTLCNPMDCRPPGSSAHGIPQARILVRVAISFSRVSSSPRDPTCFSSFSFIGRWILYHLATWEAPACKRGRSKTRRILRYEPKAPGTEGKHINWTL